MNASVLSIVACAIALSGCATTERPSLKPSAHHGRAHRAFHKAPVSVAKSPGAVVVASWYGGGEALAKRTANGQIFRPGARTAAHRSLPFGTRLRVTNVSNGRSTVVRITDRGPASWTGRALDLSRGAAAEIGMIGAGTARVRISQE